MTDPTWDPDDQRGDRYPPWLRVAVIALQVAAIVGGILLGNATYQAWSEPGIEQPTVSPTVPAVTPETSATDRVPG